MVFMTSCSQLDSLSGKLPFLENDSGTYQENEQVEEPQVDRADEDENADRQAQAGPFLQEEYFNEVKEVDGKYQIQNPDNQLALVNKGYSLPHDYIPNDLVRPNVEFSFGEAELEKSLMRKEAAAALEKMFESAKNEGIELYAVSGYRSYARQDQLFDAEVMSAGEQKALQAVAVPGTSEHQTGLAMDISSRSANFALSEQFGNTEEAKWLFENAHRFGFILRYPKGKEEITGYMYEPWHYRFTGEEAAAEIYKNNLTLEEYFGIVRKV